MTPCAAARHVTRGRPRVAAPFRQRLREASVGTDPRRGAARTCAMRGILVLALSTVGCNAILGLSPTTREVADAARLDADPAAPDADPMAPDADRSVPDAAPVTIDAQLDARPPDACVPFDDHRECTADTCGNPPLDPGTPCASGVCDGAGACVACVQDQDCGLPNLDSCLRPVCVNHACAIGPAPRDTLCNGQQDQCDGAGNCIDCTTSGGCGECCICSVGVCVPV